MIYLLFFSSFFLISQILWVRYYKANFFNILDPIYYAAGLVFLYLNLSLIRSFEGGFDEYTHYYSQMSVNIFLLILLIYVIIKDPLKNVPYITIPTNIPLYKISLILLIFGYAFLFLNYYRLFLFSYSDDIDIFNRVDRNNLLSNFRFNLPYSTFIFTSFIAAFASFIWNKISFLSLIIRLLPFFPVVIFYFVEVERSALIKIFILLFITLVFIFQFNPKKISLKISFIFVLLFIIFSLLGNLRSSIHSSFKDGNIDALNNRISNLSIYSIIPNEFSATRLTLDYSISRLNNEDNYYKDDIVPSYGTYFQSFLYIFPRSYYDLINTEKDKNIAKVIGEEIRKKIERDRPLSYGVNALAEAIFNFGYLGIIFFSLIFIYMIDKLKNLYEIKKKNFLHIYFIYLISVTIFMCFRHSFASIFNLYFQSTLILSILFLSNRIYNSFFIKFFYKINKFFIKLLNLN